MSARNGSVMVNEQTPKSDISHGILIATERCIVGRLWHDGVTLPFTSILRRRFVARFVATGPEPVQNMR